MITAFRDLDLAPALLTALENEGYVTPTEVQVQAIPEILAGRDILATAQTGTGKTAAFVLPLLQLLAANAPKRPATDSTGKSSGGGGAVNGAASNGRGARRVGVSGSARGKGAQRVCYPRALIVAPTRELAEQIDERVGAYGADLRIGHTAVYGGAPKVTQARDLQRSPDVVTATPGRLLDFISEKRISLEYVEFLVLDEADRMLDMGFIPDVRRIIAMISSRPQTTLFAATMPNEIAELAASVLTLPIRIEGTEGQQPVERIAQTVMFVEQSNKMKLLVELIERQQMTRAIVFTRTKHRASRVAKALAKERIASDAIHGDKTQNARKRALGDFGSGKVQVLVATDVAARGIDVEEISHVVNFEIPTEAETYVHRIGRTARAGAEGSAVSLCDLAEVGSLRVIERLIDARIPVDLDNIYHFEPKPPQSSRSRPNSNSGSGSRSGRSGPRHGFGRGYRGEQGLQRSATRGNRRDDRARSRAGAKNTRRT